MTREEAYKFCEERWIMDPVEALMEWAKHNPPGVVVSTINTDALMFKAYEEGYAHAKADYGPDSRPMVTHDDRYPKAALAEKEAIERVIEAEVQKRIDAHRKIWDDAYDAAKKARGDELCADAERYRWLRDVANGGDWERIGHTTTPDTTDAEVDAAMADNSKGTEGK